MIALHWSQYMSGVIQDFLLEGIMQSTQLLGGSELCFPRKCFNFRPSEFASGGFRRSVADVVVISNKGKHLLDIANNLYEILRILKGRDFLCRREIP